MKGRNILTIAIVAALLASPLGAESLEIIGLENIDGVTFYPYDFIDLGAVIVNDGDSDMNLVVEQYVDYPGSDPMPLYEEVSIKADGNEMISDLSFSVSEYSVMGDYYHYVRVYDSWGVITERVRTFSVDGTGKKMNDYEVGICGDPGCSEIKTTFILGETAYLVVDNHGAYIGGYIDYNDYSFSDLYFSDGVAEFSPASPGRFTANIVLSQEGFLDEIVEKEITFVDGFGEPTYFFCSEAEDGVCDIHCEEGKDPDCEKMGGDINFFVILGLGFVILVIVALFFLRFRGTGF